MLKNGYLKFAEVSGLGPGCVKTQANTTDRREVGKFYKIEF